MWLCDSLPDDLPNARIILYGYDTGMAGSHSFQNLEDFASTFRSTLQTLVAREEPQQGYHTRPIVFVVHSLGGLVFKEALIQMKSDKNSYDLLGLIYGALFFGVPSQGMDISHLLPMVESQLNEDLIRSLDTESVFLRKQSREFPKAFNCYDSEVVCFYETLKSPTAVKVCKSLRPAVSLLKDFSITENGKCQDRPRFLLVVFQQRTVVPTKSSRKMLVRSTKPIRIW